ncbi:hypothetical protein GINT2_000020 [Glugoides intestinalis]
METMVSSSNNTQKVIFLWQKLIWSKQPEGLLSTKSLIVISIVIFLIMTLRNGEMYYNNLLNGFLTILLTIISGIIFGKGLEILFRTLHIICSGAYGNVVFSLKDIFISLLFGCIFVSFGYCLLFNKKLYKLLRLQKSEDAILKEIMADNKAPIVNRLELTMVDKPEETVSKLKNVWIKINETVPKLHKIGFENRKTRNSLNEMEPGMNPDVKAELKEKDKNNVKLTSDLSEKLLNYELNEAGPEEIETELKAIEAGLKEIETGFQECNAILTEEKAAILAAAEEV